MDILEQKSGYGSGYGYGYGDGDGSGDGVVVGEISEWDVVSLEPWPYIKVGCQIQTVSHWRKEWQKIARSEGVSVDREQVDKILRKLNA